MRKNDGFQFRLGCPGTPAITLRRESIESCQRPGRLLTARRVVTMKLDGDSEKLGSLCACSAEIFIFNVPSGSIQPAAFYGASASDQNPAVSLRNSRHPAVLAKSKSTDRRVLRRSRSCSQCIPRNTTPELAETSGDTRDPRLSAAAESAKSPSAPPTTSRSPFPPQLSPLSDSHIAPGYHPFGPLRMSKNTQLRPLSSFGKNEI